jgi:hypothetical protein
MQSLIVSIKSPNRRRKKKIKKFALGRRLESIYDRHCSTCASRIYGSSSQRELGKETAADFHKDFALHIDPNKQARLSWNARLYRLWSSPEAGEPFTIGR